MSSLSAWPFTALVGFGDSYTDTGNLPSSPPDYWNGRFSNGPLWIESLSATLGFAYNPANNYAVSGTEANELGGAIARFPGTSDSANVLFAIWSGNNDFANHLNIGTDDAGWDIQINWIVSSLTTACDLLYQKGARNILLFNQMDLTRCPDILTSTSSSYRSYISGKIRIFNSRLASATPALLSSHPGLQIYLADIYSDFNYLLDNYPSLGFTKATIGALNDPVVFDKSFTGPGADYVFWDDQHPTTKAHALIADWATRLLPAPQPPPSVAITSPQSGAQFTAPATFPVTVAVSANAWDITQVKLIQNGSLAGQVTTAPYAFTLSSLPVGNYTLVAQAGYGSGQTIASGPIQVTVVAPTGSPLPAPWRHQDIGFVGMPGMAYVTPDGSFTISGSGADIWDVADTFHYVFQPLTANGSIVARVESQQNTDGFAKAGLMFRDSLDPGSPNVLACVTPAFGLCWQHRLALGGPTAYVPGPTAGPPWWLKLERVGNTFNGYSSGDGTAWFLLGSVSIPLSETIYAGLAVGSHNTSLLNTSIFSKVQVVPSTPPVPPVLSISCSTNSQIQLTITGSSGATYVCEMCTDLGNWIPFSTNINSSGTVRIQPPGSPTGVLNLFRARLLQ